MISLYLPKVLLDAGSLVNPVMRTGKGLLATPLDAALHKGHRGTAKYLQLHGGVPAGRLNSESAALRGPNSRYFCLLSNHMILVKSVNKINIYLYFFNIGIQQSKYNSRFRQNKSRILGLWSKKGHLYPSSKQ